MKCASTYAAHIIARYLGTDVPAVTYDWLAEQNLTRELRDQVRGRPFVLSLHMRPHAGNLAALNADEIRVCLLWRNVADIVVSFDDHAPRYGAHNPVFYVDHDTFLKAPRRQRYRHAIDRLVPWSLDYYLHWRGLPDLCLHPYEMMVADPAAYFRLLLWQMGVAIDEARLRDVLLDVPAASRFNVGVVGRSAERFDDELKQRVERHIVEHPQFDQLEVLLWELPWEPREIPRVSSLDGTTVRCDGDPVTYFVSRGVRHPVSRSWLASRGKPALREAATVDPRALAELELGASLL
jgi:hypothetical protein